MTKEERETIINWSEADDSISVYTTSGPVMTVCNRRGYEVVRNVIVNGKVVGKEYKLPLKAITFRSKRKIKRTFTPEQKAEVRERLNNFRKKKKAEKMF